MKSRPRRGSGRGAAGGWSGEGRCTPQERMRRRRVKPGAPAGATPATPRPARTAPGLPARASARVGGGGSSGEKTPAASRPNPWRAAEGPDGLRPRPGGARLAQPASRTRLAQLVSRARLPGRSPGSTAGQDAAGPAGEAGGAAREGPGIGGRGNGRAVAGVSAQHPAGQHGGARGRTAQEQPRCPRVGIRAGIGARVPGRAGDAAAAGDTAGPRQRPAVARRSALARGAGA